MSRFYFSPAAISDLEEIEAYLDSVPAHHKQAISQKLADTIISISEAPYLGIAHSDYTRAYGQEVRSRLMSPYRIYYFSTTPPEIIAILHGARDTDTILRTHLA